MKHSKRICSALFGLIAYSAQTLAGSNPIAWSLNQPFPNPISSGINYSIVYTFTNKLPFQLVLPIQIQKKASPQFEFTYDDNCSGKRLLTNEQCTVQVNLSPLAVGEKSVQLFITGYSKDVVPLPEVKTIATGLSGAVVGSVTDSLPGGMDDGTSATYMFTFTNYSASDATNVLSNVTQTTGTVQVTANSCQNGSDPGTLARNGGTCTVQGSFTPGSADPATQTVTATLSYNGPSGSPVTANTTTFVSTPGDQDIVASIVVPDYLPPLMTPGTTQQIQFLFSNVTAGPVTLSNTGTITCLDSNNQACAGTLTNLVSGCTNGSLLQDQNCNLTATFTAPAATNPPTSYTLTGSLEYMGTGSPAAISTRGTVVSTLPTARTIRVVNNCSFKVAYSLNGAALSGYSSSACPPGTSPDSSTGNCYWNNHVGTGNMLAASGGSDLVTIPAYNYGGTQWSGNISASTGCGASGPCTYATCNNNGGTTSCAVAKGFSQPATQAEITMLVNAADNYDVEVINGFHIPVSMEPVYYLNGSTVIPADAQNFDCGTPGQYAAANNFGACDWESVSLPSPTAYYYWVGGGSGNNCSSCQSGEICGLNNSFNQVCGNFLGYWTPNQLCTQANLPTAIQNTLQCATGTGFDLQPPDQFSNTYTSLMACPVAKNYTGPTYNTCYGSYPQGSDVSECCGCVDWWDNSQTGNANIQANDSAQTCPAGQTDTLWTNNIQPGIQWMKKACPSLYVYPFDDASSKFTCSNNTPGQTNTTSYIITFCDGNSGLPTNTTDGR